MTLRAKLIFIALVAVVASLGVLPFLTRRTVPAPAPTRSSTSRAPASRSLVSSDSRTTRADDRPPAREVAAGGPHAVRKRVRRELLAGLDVLQPWLTACAQKHGNSVGGTVFTLALTSLDGIIEIEDATELLIGAADATVVACARDVLRGQRIPVPSARPGRRMKMAFPFGAEPVSHGVPRPPPIALEDDG